MAVQTADAGGDWAPAQRQRRKKQCGQQNQALAGVHSAIHLVGAAGIFPSATRF